MNNNSPKVIFITGTNGAGKGAVVDFLKEKGYLHSSVSAFLENSLKEKSPGAEISRPDLAKLGNDLRRRFGPSYLVETLYDDSLLSQKNVVIESVRTAGEVIFLRSKPDAYLLAVDAGIETRYKRIKSSPTRKRSIDNVSFEQFKEQEEAESKGAGLYTQNLPECIAAADYVVHNEGTLPELYHQVNEFLRKITEEVEEKI
jgi:dephospho-CoA kinase